MKWNRGMLVAGILANCLLALPAAESWSMFEGRGAGGEPYATGGVGDEERASLIRRRLDFNVWITTAARQSGAYLANVRVKVLDAANRVVLETALDGPLLFIRLAPGRYTIEALLEEQKQQKALTAGAQGHHELYFYFDVAAETFAAESEPKAGTAERKR